jgi:tetratricopeptide (TPR) repeat protein
MREEIRPRSRLALRTLIALAIVIAGPWPAGAIDPIPDGPAAPSIRESLRCLEQGESAEDPAVKMSWYRRGKQQAETAIRLDDANANAHFALFANWGRFLQTDGWLKNSYLLPSLWRELDRALDINPNHTDALAAKGGLYLRLPFFLGGNAAKGEPLLRRAVALDAKAAGSRLELAELCLDTGRKDEARGLAEAALAIARQNGRERHVRRAEDLLERIDGAKQARSHGL